MGWMLGGAQYPDWPPLEGSLQIFFVLSLLGYLAASRWGRLLPWVVLPGLAWLYWCLSRLLDDGVRARLALVEGPLFVPLILTLAVGWMLGPIAGTLSARGHTIGRSDVAERAQYGRVPSIARMMEVAFLAGIVLLFASRGGFPFLEIAPHQGPSPTPLAPLVATGMVIAASPRTFTALLLYGRFTSSDRFLAAVALVRACAWYLILVPAGALLLLPAIS